MSLNLDSLFDTIVNVHWGSGAVFILFENSIDIPSGFATGPTPGPLPPGVSPNSVALILPTNGLVKAHVSQDGIKWTMKSFPADSWATFPSDAYGNGAWLYAYMKSQGWLYRFEPGGDDHTYILVGLYNAAAVIVQTTDGVKWTPVKTIPTGQIVRTDDQGIVAVPSPPIGFGGISFNVSKPNNFQWHQLTTPRTGHTAAVYNLAFHASPFKPGTFGIPPYPDGITDVTTDNPFIGDGQHPGFWYSKNHGATWTQTLSFPPTTGTRQTQLQLTFGQTGG